MFKPSNFFALCAASVLFAAGAAHAAPVVYTISGQGNVEGIATTDARGIYGGTDDDDNSGVFRYVQIKHSSAIVAANVELNALTLGGVGRGTTIEYVDCYAANDDGVVVCTTGTAAVMRRAATSMH